MENKKAKSWRALTKSKKTKQKKRNSINLSIEIRPKLTDVLLRIKLIIIMEHRRLKKIASIFNTTTLSINKKSRERRFCSGNYTQCCHVLILLQLLVVVDKTNIISNNNNKYFFLIFFSTTE